MQKVIRKSTANLYLRHAKLLTIVRMTVGERIKRVREGKGFSQEYMAHVLEMSQSNYHKIESGKTEKIDYKTMFKIAEVLETDLTELLPIGVHVHTNQHNYNGILIQSSKDNSELLKAKEEIIRLQAEKISYLEAELARLKNASGT